ncbi:MAG: metal-dependent transcriptional regulator [Pirellulales bacterium]
MASLTVENYVKAIYQISSENQAATAATGKVASALGVSPGTVTSMLKTLSESGLATYTPYEGVSLTPAGQKLALRVVRRHRLIELFLVKTLNMDWDEVHAEAENMEHAVSDRLIERIDSFLGQPQVDPHGDPIPRADGSLDVDETRTLLECPVGFAFRLSRVVDQSPEFLRFLSESGLRLGARGSVRANQAQAGIVTIEIAGQETSLGRDAAEKLLVSQ